MDAKPEMNNLETNRRFLRRLKRLLFLWIMLEGEYLKGLVLYVD